VKEDVIKILGEIEESSRLSKEIIENVLNFNLYSLLKVRSINHIKRDIYKCIINTCPNFLRAFKLIKCQSANPAMFRYNEMIIQKMDLIDVFFDIKLPF
jgi:hypothetical protein